MRRLIHHYQLAIHNSPLETSTQNVIPKLLAGGVAVVTAALAETDALRRAGRVKVLAIMADERLGIAPEVPTLKEQGIDWSLGGWVAVGDPAGLPDAIRDSRQRLDLSRSPQAGRLQPPGAAVRRVRSLYRGTGSRKRRLVETGGAGAVALEPLRTCARGHRFRES